MQIIQPGISVIIPAYNEEKYIIRTLEALLQQDYKNYEVIIVNNASTDRTADIVSSFIYKKKLTFKFRLLHQKRQGTQWARECGRKAASGEIIAQLDADCIPPVNWITTGINLLQQENIAAAAGPYDYFDSSFVVRTLTYISQLFILQPLNSLMQVFKKGGVIIGGNVFIRASVLEKSGGYNTALRFYGDDVDIAIKASRYGHILFTKKLMVKSSSRRYNATGFLQEQSKYINAFFKGIFQKGLAQQDSIEPVHPR